MFYFLTFNAKKLGNLLAVTEKDALDHIFKQGRGSKNSAKTFLLGHRMNLMEFIDLLIVVVRNT